LKELLCIKQFELVKILKTVITMANNLTDMMFDDSFYLGAWAYKKGSQPLRDFLVLFKSLYRYIGE